MKKILSILFAFILILTTLLFVACGDVPDKTEDKEPDTTQDKDADKGEDAGEDSDPASLDIFVGNYVIANSEQLAELLSKVSEQEFDDIFDNLASKGAICGSSSCKEVVNDSLPMTQTEQSSSFVIIPQKDNLVAPYLYEAKESHIKKETTADDIETETKKSVELYCDGAFKYNKNTSENGAIHASKTACEEEPQILSRRQASQLISAGKYGYYSAAYNFNKAKVAFVYKFGNSTATCEVSQITLNVLTEQFTGIEVGIDTSDTEYIKAQISVEEKAQSTLNDLPTWETHTLQIEYLFNKEYKWVGFRYKYEIIKEIKLPNTDENFKMHELSIFYEIKPSDTTTITSVQGADDYELLG